MLRLFYLNIFYLMGIYYYHFFGKKNTKYTYKKRRGKGAQEIQ